MNDYCLPSISPDLLTHRLDGQLLVYDPGDNQVHLLDSVTARVFEMMEEGGWTRAAACEEIAAMTGAPETDVLLELALDDLRAANLVSEPSDNLSEAPGMRRREVLKKLAAAGVIAAAIPGIVTITASGQTGSCFEACHGCATDDQCCGALICGTARVNGHLVSNVCVSSLTPPIDVCAVVIA